MLHFNYEFDVVRDNTIDLPTRDSLKSRQTREYPSRMEQNGMIFILILLLLVGFIQSFQLENDRADTVGTTSDPCAAFLHPAGMLTKIPAQHNRLDPALYIQPRPGAKSFGRFCHVGHDEFLTFGERVTKQLVAQGILFCEIGVMSFAQYSDFAFHRVLSFHLSPCMPLRSRSDKVQNDRQDFVDLVELLLMVQPFEYVDLHFRVRDNLFVLPVTFQRLIIFRADQPQGGAA